ncbi:hypothetical protein NJ76_31520 [Rhodococcus sp. IITR03]|nr:hypothetical protein NJ76_31520 [Rhodococcus sp. IITR03]
MRRKMLRDKGFHLGGGDIGVRGEAEVGHRHRLTGRGGVAEGVGEDHLRVRGQCASISPSSTRKPRILTWKSVRPT